MKKIKTKNIINIITTLLLLISIISLYASSLYRNKFISLISFAICFLLVFKMCLKKKKTYFIKDSILLIPIILFLISITSQYISSLYANRFIFLITFTFSFLIIFLIFSIQYYFAYLLIKILRTGIKGYSKNRSFEIEKIIPEVNYNLFHLLGMNSLILSLAVTFINFFIEKDLLIFFSQFALLLSLSLFIVSQFFPQSLLEAYLLKLEYINNGFRLPEKLKFKLISTLFNASLFQVNYGIKHKYYCFLNNYPNVSKMKKDLNSYIGEIDNIDNVFKQIINRLEKNEILNSKKALFLLYISAIVISASGICIGCYTKIFYFGFHKMIEFKSLYLSLTTFTTIGFGDFVPKNELSYFYMIMILFQIPIFLFILINSFTDLHSKSKAKREDKLFYITYTLKSKALSYLDKLDNNNFALCRGHYKLII